MEHPIIDLYWQESLKPLNWLDNHWFVLAGITKTTKLNVKTLFSIDFPLVLIRKSKGNGPRSSQAYFLFDQQFQRKLLQELPGSCQTYTKTNTSEHQPLKTCRKTNISELRPLKSYRKTSISELRPWKTYRKTNISELRPSKT